MSEYGVVTEPRTIRMERLLPGPIERVWDYLTDSAKRGKWFAAGKMDLRVGGVSNSSSTTPIYRRRKRRRRSTRTRRMG